MFDWLNAIFQFIFNLFPRWELLDPTDGGVKFKPRNKIVELKPGRMYWYWPVTTNVYTLSARRQSLQVEQVLTTDDAVSCVVKTVIVYTIDDVMKALVETTDFDDTIAEMAQKGTVAVVMSRGFDKIVADLAYSTDIKDDVTKAARSALQPFGVKVEDGFIASFAQTKVVSHMGEGLAYGGWEDEE